MNNFTSTQDAFEFDDKDSFLYSLKGGCACNASSLMGGDGNVLQQRRRTNNKLSGGAFALAPYITAISLLAVRLLRDKNIGLFPVSGGSDKKMMRRNRH